MLQELKFKLLEYCHNIVDQKINDASDNIRNLQSSANEESKSSMGDKYETGRAMMHLEQKKYALQLEEGLKLRKTLSLIEAAKSEKAIGMGNLVKTNHALFYISISIGTVKVAAQEVICISPATPIAGKMKGKSVGEAFEMNGRKYNIIDVI